jgi:hypothetical protein
MSVRFLKAVPEHNSCLWLMISKIENEREMLGAGLKSPETDAPNMTFPFHARDRHCLRVADIFRSHVSQCRPVAHRG